MASKQQLLDVAEVIDAYRSFPRAFLLLYYLILWDAHRWYVALPNPTEQQQLYMNVLWVSVAAATGFYVATGRKWSG